MRRNPRPSGPSFTLNIAVDELFKREFDRYRAKRQPHPLFATVGLDAVPLQDPRMDAWRTNFTGVRDLRSDRTCFMRVGDTGNAVTGIAIHDPRGWREAAVRILNPQVTGAVDLKHQRCRADLPGGLVRQE